MEFQYRYLGDSHISNHADSTQMSFAPDSLRQPTYFSGRLSRQLPFREAISALHEVVESDMRYQPRDLSDYKAWLASQNELFLAQALSRQGQIKTRLEDLRSELRALSQTESSILQPYYDAQRKYFNYLYKHDIDAWYVLDPVISVHPDSIFFECFSLDESSYGKLSCNYEVFDQIREHAYGTTNIDYSHALYQEFQKVRDYKDTQLTVDPSGFSVQTGVSESFKEEKIELPDSWVRGFLQVSSAMTLPLHSFDLHPMDLYNILLYLRRHRERSSPRSLRFLLTPGEPVTVVIDPWNHQIKCPRSIYTGSSSEEVRLWGRRRLFILERLLPIASKIRVQLLGSGMPSFWTAEMPGMTFTLGLSGWSASDFSRMGNFDLLAPRGNVDSETAQRVFAALQQHWVESAASLAKRLNLDLTTVKSALGIYAQSGRVLYDLWTDQYRIRELSREPLPMDQLRFANEREDKANRLIKAGLVEKRTVEVNQQGMRISAEVLDNGRIFTPEIRIDADQRLVDGSCGCHFYISNKLKQGPCEHMLAIRITNTD